MLAAKDCRVVLSFLQRSSSFSLASASLVQHDNESWLKLARQRAYLTNTYNLNSYDSRTRAWADVFRQKKNVPQRCSFLIFSIFLHQISCRRVQSIFETTSTKSEACPTMPCISLVINTEIMRNPAVPGKSANTQTQSSDTQARAELWFCYSEFQAEISIFWRAIYVWVRIWEVCVRMLSTFSREWRPKVFLLCKTSKPSLFFARSCTGSKRRRINHVWLHFLPVVCLRLNSYPLNLKGRRISHRKHTEGNRRSHFLPCFLQVSVVFLVEARPHVRQRNMRAVQHPKGGRKDRFCLCTNPETGVWAV